MKRIGTAKSVSFAEAMRVLHPVGKCFACGGTFSADRVIDHMCDACYEMVEQANHQAEMR